MKSFQESLQEIDWIRNTLWLIFYIVGVVLLFVGWVAPSLDEFRRANIEYRKADFLYQETEREHERLKEELRLFEETNASNLRRFLHRDTLEDLQALLAPFFSELQLTELARERDKRGFDVLQLRLEGRAKNAAALLAFMREVSEIERALKLDFPLLLTSESEGLFLRAKLQLYYSETIPSLKQ